MQTASWHACGHELKIAVNLSPRQFRQKNLTDAVMAALREASLTPGNLELEITEGTAIANPERTITILSELRGFGATFAVDDFGTGYSSLSYLKRFPLDCLKIDRSFVLDLSEDPNSEAIIRATVALAHSLKLRVVAEGVETEQHRDLLAQAGCDEYQGYYFGKPIPPSEFAAAFLK